MIIHPMYGEGPNHGLTIIEQGESSARFTLEAIREAPAEYGVGAALVLLKLPPLSVTVFVEWTRLEDYYPEREGWGWRNLWLQFGAAPGRQHPVFYVRPNPRGYEVGWNMGAGKEQQIILGDLGGRPVVRNRGRCYFGIRQATLSIGSGVSYVGSYRWDTIREICGAVPSGWLGVYDEGCKAEVGVRMEVE